MRLSDKNIAAIRAAAEDNDMKFGFGDVLLLCDEVQTRRSSEAPWPAQAAESEPYLGQVTASALIQELIKCVEEESEPLRGAAVLDLFHALQRQGYFSATCLVDRDALKKLLYALSAPEQPHLIREIQATRGLPCAEGEARNPIDQLIVDMNNKGQANAAS